MKSLKNKLSKYVRLARGWTVVITDRGRAVAEIVSPQRQRHGSSFVVERGVREGWLTPAKKTISTTAAAQADSRIQLEQCSPTSTATGKIAGELHRQFRPASRLLRGTSLATRDILG